MIRTGRLTSILSLALLVAACGGGGGEGGGGTASPPPAPTPVEVAVVEPAPIRTSDPFVSPGAASASRVTRFDEAAATAVRESGAFRKQRFRWGGLDTFSFADVRAEYPLSIGITGRHQTIAIVDDGFRPSHDEFAGKSVRTFGTVPVADHGTAVAAIAAGADDGRGMMGIAPGADLHLSSFRTDFAGLAAATRDAIATSDAVVQNNSWGFVDRNGKPIPIAAVQSRLASDPRTTLPKAMQAVLGGSETGIAAYLDALRAFTARGVVVFAAPNDRDATSLSVMDGLPLVAPELTQGWIVAINAVPVREGGEIVGAQRLSAACLQLAHTCLAANGLVHSATAQADDHYQNWNGTSFSAPQIAAGIAILAEAFPGLPPSDLRRRLLASANNRFFAHVGVTDFGNGVLHGFGEEFGHGFMDLAAALMPIGATGLPVGSSVHDGVAPLGATALVSGDAQGDALVRGLGAQTITVFDSLGADFAMPGLGLYGGESRTSTPQRLERFAARTPVARAGIDTGAEAATSPTAWAWQAGPATGIAHRVGPHGRETPLVAGAGALVGLAPDAIGIAAERRLGERGRLALYGFASPPADPRPERAGLAAHLDRADPAAATGAGLAWTGMAGPASLSVGASLLSEGGAFLGLATSDAAAPLRGTAGAVDLGLDARVAPGTRLSLSAQVGSGEARGGGLLGARGRSLFSAFGAAVSRHDVVASGDTLRVFVRQPLRIEAGSLRLRVPSGRSEDGTVAWRTLAVESTPSARQIDIGAEYEIAWNARSRLKLGIAYSHAARHTRGSHAVSAMGAFDRAF